MRRRVATLLVLGAACLSQLGATCLAGGFGREIDGDVAVLDSLDADALRDVSRIVGDLYIGGFAGASWDFELDVELPALQEVTGDVVVRGVSELRLPLLGLIGGDLVLDGSLTALDLGSLREVDGEVTGSITDCLRGALGDEDGPVLDDTGLVYFSGGQGCSCDDDERGGLRLGLACLASGGASGPCLNYLDCQEAVDEVQGTNVFDSLLDVYGPDGTCWTTTVEAAAACTDACRSALDANSAAFPDLAACR